jgi:hypothetical protein
LNVGIIAHPKPNPTSARDKIADQSSLFKIFKEIDNINWLLFHVATLDNSYTSRMSYSEGVSEFDLRDAHRVAMRINMASQFFRHAYETFLRYVLRYDLS